MQVTAPFPALGTRSRGRWRSRSAASARWKPFPTPSAFDRLETEWNDAVERAAVPHPFLRHEWLHTWWECFGDGRALHIVIVRSNDRIIAIAPLLRESVSCAACRSAGSA